MADPKILVALKKARSHIDKIISMEEEQKYCIDIIQQLNAVVGYLNSAKNQKLKNHLRSCFLQGMQKKSEEEKEGLIDEVIRATKISS
jgi:CsoR family transcriptional regulator, copper-sensing transcriptional repressor